MACSWQLNWQMGWASGTAVEAQLGTPTFCVGVPGFKTALCFWPCVVDCADGSNMWLQCLVLAAHVQDPGEVLGSGMTGFTPDVDSQKVPLSPSYSSAFFQINIALKRKVTEIPEIFIDDTDEILYWISVAASEMTRTATDSRSTGLQGEELGYKMKIIPSFARCCNQKTEVECWKSVLILQLHLNFPLTFISLTYFAIDLFRNVCQIVRSDCFVCLPFGTLWLNSRSLFIQMPAPYPLY